MNQILGAKVSIKRRWYDYKTKERHQRVSFFATNTKASDSQSSTKDVVKVESV